MCSINTIVFTFIYIAGSGSTFSISNSGFQNGENVVDITITHPECPQPGHLQLEFPYQAPPTTPLPSLRPPTISTPPPTTPPSPSPLPTQPPLTCDISRQETDVVFTCSSYSAITMISYFINGIPVGSSR